MASAGDGIGEAEAGATKKNTRRISDYLGDSDGGEASPPSPETPPQLQLHRRFTCARFRLFRLGRKRGGRKEAATAVRSEDASFDASGTKQAEASTASAPAEAGMGLCVLLLLLARTCVELNRMAAVRAQMEALLDEIRDEAGRMKAASADHAAGTPGTCCKCNLQPSLTTAVSSSCTSDTDTNRHANTDAEIARRDGEGEPPDDEGRARAAELEAEQEAEPSQPRLLQYNSEQESSESSDDEFIELEGGRFGGGGGDLEWDFGDEESVGESTGAQEQDGGVCATELERRLHELLHRRNRERIEELESALRLAEQKLREKEMEARMWQDTVTLALQPPPRDGQ